MVSWREDRRRNCREKKPYRSYSQALVVAERETERVVLAWSEVVPYPCRHCRFWHVGHQEKKGMVLSHMTEQGYTPGPWRIGNHGAIIANESAIPEAHGTSGHDDTEYYGGYLIAESVMPRNIPLIAVAPELLEACEVALEAFRLTREYLGDSLLPAYEGKPILPAMKGWSWYDATLILKAAIAKAKGEKVTS